MEPIEKEELKADLEHLRKSYNAAIANGLHLRASRIAKIIEAVESKI